MFGVILESKIRAGIIGGVALAVLVVLGFIIFGGGGGEEEVDGGADGEVLAVDFGADAAVPEVSMEESVQRTIEAMATPEPTPDVPATLMAVVEQTREAQVPVVTPSVLSRVVDGNTFLSDSDITFVTSLGGVMWEGVQGHLVLERLLETPPNEWDSGPVESGLGRVEVHLQEARRLQGNVQTPSGDVQPAVREYAQHLRQAIGFLDEAVREMRSGIIELQRAGGWDDMTPTAKRELNGMFWRASTALQEFSRAMGQYGCSICGEMYRYREDG